MMRKGSRRAVVVVALAASLSALGCELALDFDRTKIDGGGIDASFGDVTVPETGGGDVVAEAAADAPGEAAAEGGTDAGQDTGTDTGTDAGTDAPADAEDSG